MTETMPVSRADISQLVETIWVAFLGLEPVCPRPGPLAATDAPWVGARTALHGDWQGTIALDCPEGLARRAAAVMYGAAPESLTPEDVLDALGELSNMMSGNIKALLPGFCEVSRPTVDKGTAASLAVVDGEVIEQSLFDCQGEPFRITIYVPMSKRQP